MQLTKNFTMEELVRSETATSLGIDNTPSEEVKANLAKLADLLQKVRNEWGEAITVTSGYRCAALNKAVKGSSTSQHLKGEAADIKCAGKKSVLFAVIKKMIMEGRLVVGQLIWEYGSSREPAWIHISLPREGKKNNQVLYLYS